jgi:hypothetical protein
VAQPTMEVTCIICTTEGRFSLSTTPVGVHVTQIRTPRSVTQSGNHNILVIEAKTSPADRRAPLAVATDRNG